MRIKKIVSKDQSGNDVGAAAQAPPPGGGPLTHRSSSILSTLKEKMFAAAEQMIVSRQSLWNRMIDPRRDYDKECGYPLEILPDQYKQYYDRHGVGHRVVEVYPKECWVKRPDLYETEDSDETEFEKAWNALQERMNLWYYLARADVVSGIGRFGVVLLGLSDGKELDQPVGGAMRPVGNARPGSKAPSTPKLDLLFLRVFDESVVAIQSRETDTKSPRYGQPNTYTIMFEEAIRAKGVLKSRIVHWTRVIHIADNCLESEVYGTPRMKVVFNRLIDIVKVLGGGGEMFWRGAFPGYAFEALPGVQDSDIDKDSLKEELENYSNGMQRWLSVVGLSVKPLTPQVADPSPTLGAILQDICITIEVPKRVFMGSEQGELASSQDAQRWNERLHGRCEGHVTPKVIRPLVDRLIQVGVLPQPLEYTVKWPDRNTSTNSEKADVALKKTQALAAYVNGDVDQLIPPPEYMTQILEMDQSVVDTIVKAAAAYQSTIEHLHGGGQSVPGQGPDPTLTPIDPNKVPTGNEEGDDEEEKTPPGKSELDVFQEGVELGMNAARASTPAPTPPLAPIAPQPVNLTVKFEKGAIEAGTTIEKGAVQVDSPITFEKDSIKSETTIAEGAVKNTTTVEAPQVKFEKGAIDSTTTIAEGAVQNTTIVKPADVKFPPLKGFKVERNVDDQITGAEPK